MDVPPLFWVIKYALVLELRDHVCPGLRANTRPDKIKATDQTKRDWTSERDARTNNMQGRQIGRRCLCGLKACVTHWLNRRAAHLHRYCCRLSDPVHVLPFVHVAMEGNYQLPCMPQITLTWVRF